MSNNFSAAPFFGRLFQRQADAVSFGVYRDDARFDGFADTDDIQGVSEGMTAQFRAVDKARRFQAEIDKDAEVDDVLHGPSDEGARLQLSE